MTGPRDGVRVVELGVFVAAGTPEGLERSVFELDNRGKRSLVLLSELGLMD